ncbi:hypothetical protein [Chromohalobacter moromii]|uniref:Uncharacterized protein n=1 Tax=Chromohalobacter moromii TaxID=2860329 RepID=A0A9X2WZR2_9GAMM|nr:hypothetical protein [Chromohalobacter moromii]MCK2044827.1 hypothetical protein [Chromohalobacter moromii]MCT8504020.1 hypothetical protein [Chromohalobacter moromii]
MADTLAPQARSERMARIKGKDTKPELWLRRLVHGMGFRYRLQAKWDVLHLGRSWADKCQPRVESQEQVIREARDHLRNNPPPEDNSMISA